MPDSAHFDQWYADMSASPVKDDILRRHLGLPSSLGSAGVLVYPALAEIAAVVEGALVDVACGRGGYGIEVALRAGARLHGVDFSAVALEQARSIAARRLPTAAFTVGTLTATGLPDSSADALMCTDSIQFASPLADALAEFRRVLRPGGRLVLTTWQPTTPGDPRLGERLRGLALGPALSAAGFRDVSVEPRPEWYAAERRAFEEAVSLPSSDDDPALASFQAEGRRSLERWDALGRIVAYAFAP